MQIGEILKHHTHRCLINKQRVAEKMERVSKLVLDTVRIMEMILGWFQEGMVGV